MPMFFFKLQFLKMLQLCCGLSSWLLCLAKIHKVKQNWSVLRAPFLSNVLVTHVSLLKGNCRVFIFSTLKVVLHHLLLGLSCPQGNVHLDLSRSWRSKAPELFYSLGEQSLCCNRKKRTMTFFPDIFKGRRKKKKKRWYNCSVSVFKNNCQALLGEGIWDLKEW